MGAGTGTGGGGGGGWWRRRGGRGLVGKQEERTKPHVRTTHCEIKGKYWMIVAFSSWGGMSVVDT